MLALEVCRENGISMSDALQLTLYEAYQSLGVKLFWTPSYVDGQTS